MILIHPTLFTGSNEGAYGQGWREPVTAKGTPLGWDTASLGRLITKYVWSPCIWEGGVRRKAHFRAAQWIALDFDEGTELWDAWVRFDRFRHVIGLTRNHQRWKGEKPPCDRFRVVLWAVRPVTEVREYEAIMKHLVHEHHADASCVDGARPFFPCREIVSAREDGEPFPLPDVTPRQYMPPPAPHYPAKWKELGFEKNGIYTQGRRNSDCHYWAHRLKERGVSRDEALVRLRAHTDLPDGELHKVIRSVFD